MLQSSKGIHNCLNVAQIEAYFYRIQTYISKL